MDASETTAEKKERLSRLVTYLIGELGQGKTHAQLRQRLEIAIMISPVTAEEGAAHLRQFDTAAV